jgi:site-specific DNA-methyltransferase (adenine-specific)
MSNPTLVYDSDGIKVYQGDALDVLALYPPSRGVFLLTDPPYGVSERTKRGTNQRSAIAAAKDFEAIMGDDKPFDPAPLVAYPVAVLWGANYYANRLPHSPSWLVWDKLAGLESKRELGFNDNADVEMAWTNLGGPARLIPHRWMGIMKGSEHGQRRIHPTQKPIALSESIIRHFAKPGQIILDPYCGSGSTLVAAQRLGFKAVGCDMVPAYVRGTIERIVSDR